MLFATVLIPALHNDAPGRQPEVRAWVAALVIGNAAHILIAHMS
jgi:hypothetical protein